MPDQHATLSPSSSERWLNCPASVRLQQQVPAGGGTGGVYAQEGTLAHTRCELEAGLHFELISQAEYTTGMATWVAAMSETTFDAGDMARHAAAYVQLLDELKQGIPNSVLMLEQRMNTGVPECWGTSDAVIVSPAKVHIVDFKYGQGVRVDAADNSQLKLYAVGALDTFGDLLGDVDDVAWTVHQPRLGHTSHGGTTAANLRAWRDTLVPVAEEALQGSDRFGPSEDACRFCPAAGLCRARAEHIALEDFAKPAEVAELLSPEEVASVLARQAEVKAYLAAVEKQALDSVYSQGGHVPGWKVVLSGGRRGIPKGDQAAAVQLLIDAGYTAEQVATFGTKGLGQLEKVVGGRARLDQLVGPLITKSTGSPALVPESDKREAATFQSDAAGDFKPVE